MSVANGKAPTNERSGMRQFLSRCWATPPTPNGAGTSSPARKIPC